MSVHVNGQYDQVWQPISSGMTPVDITAQVPTTEYHLLRSTTLLSLTVLSGSQVWPSLSHTVSAV